MSYDVEKPDEQWRAELTPAEYAVLRQAGTEPAFTGEYTDTKTKGVYSCRACGAELFTSDSNFGWPSFFHRVRVLRVEEGGPAAVGLELLVRAEQLRAAGATLVHTFGLRVGVLAGEGTLGRRFSPGTARQRSGNQERFDAQLHFQRALPHFRKTRSVGAAQRGGDRAFQSRCLRRR